jgi:hypothetical protein
MQKLLKTWKQFLLEEKQILQESAKTVNDLLAAEKKHPEFKLCVTVASYGDRMIAIRYTCYVKNTGKAYYKNVIPGFPRGEIEIGRPPRILGACLAGWAVYYADADSGWGPLLYDVAMEYATEHGGGLMADRGSVSSDAKAVWDYYDQRRRDVRKDQLDNLSPPPEQLTPNDISDDCGQESAIEWAEKDYGTDKKWNKESLSRLFRSKGTPTIDALKKIGRYKDLVGDRFEDI